METVISLLWDEGEMSLESRILDGGVRQDAKAGHLPGLGRTQNNLLPSLLVHPVSLVLLLPASGHHAQASVGSEGARGPHLPCWLNQWPGKMVPELRLPSAGEF